MRFLADDPVFRRAFARDLSHSTFSATSPGSESERREAVEAAQRLADEAFALLVRETWPDDEVATALAEYLNAEFPVRWAFVVDIINEYYQRDSPKRWQNRHLPF